MVLAANLRALRSAAGSTQTSVAERAGIARAHYGALEAGLASNGNKANPRLDTLINLATALEVTLAQLLEGIGPSGVQQPLGPRY